MLQQPVKVALSFGESGGQCLECRSVLEIEEQHHRNPAAPVVPHPSESMSCCAFQMSPREPRTAVPAAGTAEPAQSHSNISYTATIAMLNMANTRRASNAARGDTTICPAVRAMRDTTQAEQTEHDSSFVG